MAIKNYTGGYNIDLDKVMLIVDWLNQNKKIRFIKSNWVDLKQINISKIHVGGCLGYLCKLGYLNYFSGKSRKRTYTVNRNKKGEVVKK